MRQSGRNAQRHTHPLWDSPDPRPATGDRRPGPTSRDDRWPGNEGGKRRRSLCLGALMALAMLMAFPGLAHARGGPNASASPAPGTLVGHGGPVRAVRFDPARRRLLTCSFDYSMLYWDPFADPPRRLRRFGDYEGAVNAVAFLPDGKRALSAGDDGRVYLHDLEDGKLILRLKGHTGKIVSLAVSPDGRTAASASWDRTVRLWDLEKGAPGPVLRGHRGPVNAVAFSRDGSAVFTAGYDGTIRLWSSSTGDQLRIVYKHGWGINVLERLPRIEGVTTGGQLLFGALDGTAGIVDVATGKRIRTLKKHEGPVLALALIDKPGLAATGGGDGVIRVYRIGDWARLEEHHNPYGPIWAMAFAKRGSRIYYGGLDDFVTLWQVSPRKPFERVASRYPRRFQVGKSSAPSLGERQFARKCSICHTLTRDGKNRAGPTLHGLFGRKAGSLPGYPYSKALKESGIVWTEETVRKLFALGPEHYTPGSKMPLQKITDTKARDALIRFLKTATAPVAAAAPDPGKPEPGKAAQ